MLQYYLELLGRSSWGRCYLELLGVELLGSETAETELRTLLAEDVAV